MDFSQKEPFELHRGKRDWFDPELAGLEDLLYEKPKRRFGSAENPTRPAWCGATKEYMAQKKRESRARKRIELQAAS